MRITIYTRNDCVQCHATKRAMENRGFDFEMINVDRVPEAAEALRAQGFRQLPVVIAQKCGVPWLYRFELMGTQSDIENVRKGVTEFWQRQPQNA
ncbi:TPA: hypothetical protein JLK04_000050 [Escherichia coli]|nr:hypothetical protein [Escherichia coli]